MLCVAVSRSAVVPAPPSVALRAPPRSLVRQPPRSLPLRVSSRWAASVFFSGITGFETAVVDVATGTGTGIFSYRMVPIVWFFLPLFPSRRHHTHY